MTANDKRTADYNTEFMRAVKKGDTRKVAEMLEDQPPEVTSAIMKAIKNHDHKKVKSILST